MFDLYTRAGEKKMVFHFHIQCSASLMHFLRAQSEVTTRKILVPAMSQLAASPHFLPLERDLGARRDT